MGGNSNAIGVRTKHDREEEEHDKKLMERIIQENSNPFQATVDPILAQASHVYNTYLYASGVMFLGLAFWGAYPSFVRFRHAHLFRYRRAQLSLRCGIFGTEHMPKWNKKYLQRVVVPPLPTADVPATTLAASPPGPAEPSTAVSVAAPPESGVAVSAAEAASPFAVQELSAARTARGSFGAGDTDKSEEALRRSLQRINADFFGPKKAIFDAPVDAGEADKDVRIRVAEAVAAAHAVVVLKESHATVRSIPEGWEVWWVSEPEARRRRFCKFWLGGLACARAFQDLLDMPDMPDLIT